MRTFFDPSRPVQVEVSEPLVLIAIADPEDRTFYHTLCEVGHATEYFHEARCGGTEDKDIFSRVLQLPIPQENDNV